MRLLRRSVAAVGASAWLWLLPLTAFAGSAGELTQEESVSPVPEPAAILAFAAGTAVVGWAIHRRRRS